jgi:hypothetical protein
MMLETMNQKFMEPLNCRPYTISLGASSALTSSLR